MLDLFLTESFGSAEDIFKRTAIEIPWTGPWFSARECLLRLDSSSLGNFVFDENEAREARDSASAWPTVSSRTSCNDSSKDLIGRYLIVTVIAPRPSAINTNQDLPARTSIEHTFLPPPLWNLDLRYERPFQNCKLQLVLSAKYKWYITSIRYINDLLRYYVYKWC